MYIENLNNDGWYGILPYEGGIMMKSDYKVLMKRINAKDEVEYFRVTNHRIDDILETRSNKQETLDALICQFEGYNNTSSAYTVMSIAYAVCMTEISVVVLDANSIIKTIWTFILGLAGISLVFCAIFAKRYSVRSAFILSALRIKREKLLANTINSDTEEKNPQEDISPINSSEPDEEYEHVYTVKVRSR